MYVNPNFPTKVALKRALLDGEYVTIFQPGPFGGNEPTNGIITVEGPHYPKPHKWYGRVVVEDGQVKRVLK